MMNREVSMFEMAERVELKFGQMEAQPYWAAYQRIIHSDLPWINDEDIDRMLEQGKQRLAS